MKHDGTPIQRSVSVNPSHYTSERVNVPKLGVILDVRNADDHANRSSSQYSDFRGFMAEATVYLIDDSTTIHHVLITPDSASGLDNFEESLPRASTKTVTGENYDSNLSQIDTHDLDGDWCIVEFLNGSIHRPFISRYWPNPRNIYDCATSGQGNPRFTTGVGTALDQKGRYFRRVNGVEYVVNRDGDIYISTYRAGNTLALSNIPSNDGRFPRLNNGQGGSILLNVKPSKVFEISFNEQVDGIGPDSLADVSLPQRNPYPASPIPLVETLTTLKADKDTISINVPISFNVRSKQKVLIEAPVIHLGENPTSLVALSNLVMNELNRIITTLNNLISAHNTHVHTMLVNSAAMPAPPAPPSTLTSLTILPANAVATMLSANSVAAVKVHAE